MIILNGKRIDGIVGDTLPIGTISAYVGLVAPKGYLLCQGQLVDKAKYSELYNLCGDTFGAATTTQFYLPDLQNKVIGGYKPNDDIFGTFGSSVGAKSVATGNHTLTTDEIPSHRHAYWHSNSATDLHALTIDQIPSHTHSILRGTAGDSWFGFSSREVQNPPYSGNTEATGGGQGHQHSLGGYWDWSSYECGSGAHNHGNITVVQPTIVLNWIIKAFTIVPNQSEVVNIISQSNIDVYSANFVNSLLDQMKQEAFDFAHPVGGFYETTDADWTPTNAGWYGTWVKEDDGTILVSYKSSGAFNKVTGTIVGGETTSYTPAGTNTGGAVGSHTLTAAESGLPSHNHTISHQGWYNVPPNTTGSERYAMSFRTISGDDTSSDFGCSSPSKNATSGHNHPFTQPTFTGTQADISTIQTSKVIYRWHRTA